MAGSIRSTWFDSLGSPALMGFAGSAIHPTGERVHEDVAAMLVLTTLILGAARVIATALSARGADLLIS